MMSFIFEKNNSVNALSFFKELSMLVGILKILQIDNGSEYKNAIKNIVKIIKLDIFLVHPTIMKQMEW